MTIANGLAERIHAIHYDTLPDDALHWARVAILDIVGVTLAGAGGRGVMTAMLNLGGPYALAPSWPGLTRP